MLEIRIIIMCLPTFLFGTTLEPGKLNEVSFSSLYIYYLFALNVYTMRAPKSCVKAHKYMYLYLSLEIFYTT